jgi:hypothetical protein
MTETGESTDAPDATRGRRVRRRRRLIVPAAVVGTVVVLFLVVTAFTGLGGPEWMRRYPYGDLRDLAGRINAEAGDFRTPDDCWRTAPSKDGVSRDASGPLRDIAKVDYVRSRVVVRAYAAESGRVDWSTQKTVTDRLDALFDGDPQFSWAMIQLEPSPDGWSPLVSCRLVTRGSVTGF